MGARYVDCFSTSVSVASGEATHTGAGVYDAAGKPARALTDRLLVPYRPLARTGLNKWLSLSRISYASP